MRTTTGLYVVLALGLLASCGKKIPDDIIQPPRCRMPNRTRKTLIWIMFSKSIR